MSRAGRSLYFFERFLFVGGRHTWNVLLAARREGPLDTEAVQAALAQLQARHPMLRAAIDRPVAAPAFVFPKPPPAIGLCIRSRHGDTWFEAVQAELEQPFDVATGPLARLVWIHAERSSDLVLVAHHCICDGRSVQILMRELLALLDRPNEPLPPPPDPFSMTALCGGPPRGAERLVQRLLAAGAGSLLRVLAARVEPPAAARPPNYIVPWPVTAALSTALARRCAEAGVTRYTAVATALLRAFRTVRPDARHRLLCPVDMRSLPVSLPSDALFGFAEAVTLPAKAAADFWDESRALRRALDRRRLHLDPRRKLQAAERLHGSTGRLIDLLLHGRAGEDIMFSDLGRAELGAGHRVLAFAASMPWQGATALFAVRQGDELVLLFVSRETHLARTVADQLQRATFAQLEQALEEAATRTPRR